MRKEGNYMENKVQEWKIISILFLALVIFIYFGMLKQKTDLQVMLPVNQKIIILDAGHGGWDPGKVGTIGADEKDINLSIMLKLQSFLEQGGATVYITRDTDEALGDTKNEDMKQRKVIANENDGDILISIHQNAFTTQSAKGSQVFYYETSEEGESLALSVQEALKRYVDTSNEREMKANADYYVLRTTEIPAILIECGFLSNREEEQALNDPIYQEKMAWGIYMGVLDYFAEEMI